jgi:hypothetical protein
MTAISRLIPIGDSLNECLFNNTEAPNFESLALAAGYTVDVLNFAKGGDSSSSGGLLPSTVRSIFKQSRI